MLMGEIPIGVGLIFGGLGQLNFGNCIYVFEFKVRVLLCQVYGCMKSVDIFFPGYSQYIIVSKMFSVAFLQETHSTERSETTWKAQWGGGVRYNTNTEQEQLTVLNQLDEFLDTIEIKRYSDIVGG